MAFELNDNSGVLFRDKKATGNQASHTGSAKIEGVEYWINGWVKDGKNGKFFSFAFKRKEGQQQQTNQTPPDDDIPF